MLETENLRLDFPQEALNAFTQYTIAVDLNYRFLGNFYSFFCDFSLETFFFFLSICIEITLFKKHELLRNFFIYEFH